jgi:hypothetical protein
MAYSERLRKFPRNEAIIQKSDRLFNVFPTAFDLETIMTTVSKWWCGSRGSPVSRYQRWYQGGRDGSFSFDHHERHDNLLLGLC